MSALIRVSKDGYDWIGYCRLCSDQAWMDRWDHCMEWAIGHAAFTHSPLNLTFETKNRSK